jgi:hypothetical protein
VENVSHHEMWQAIYEMLGSSAAGLVGLLFVATSIHFDEIKNKPDYIVPARNNTYHLLTLLVEAVLILIPQPLSTLGLELVAINLFALRLPVSVTRKYFSKNIGLSHAHFPVKIIGTIITGYLLGVAGGVGLIVHADWGLYLLTACFVIVLVRTVLTAWEIMFGLHIG